ncbi:MFS transporter [Chloroflexota bacterium]
MSEVREPESFFRQWGGGTAVFFTYTHLSHDLCTGLLVALLPLVREGLGLSYLQSGLLLSALTITSGLSQFPGGWLGDRFSRRIVIAVGLGGVGITALAVGLSPSYYPMLAILITMGIFAGAYHPSAVSMLSNYFEAARRGRVIALHMVGGSIGFTIGPILGGLIANTLGWRFAFIILSIPTLLAVPVILKKLKLKGMKHEERQVTRTSTDSNGTSQPTSQSISIFQALKPVLIIMILAILMQLIAGSAMAFMPLYLVDKHHIAPAYAAMLLGLIRAGGIAGSLFGGWLSDKWGRKSAIFLALAATGPVLLLLTNLPFHAGLIVVFILFGFLMPMRQATVQPFIMDGVPPQIRATVFGIYFGLATEGMSLVQPLAGHFMDIYGIIDVFGFITWSCVALSVVSLALARKA